MEPSASLTDMVKQALNKLQEQGQLISLLQAEVAFQNDRMAKQEDLIKDLSNEVKELREKFASGQNNNEAIDSEKDNKSSDIWQETKKLSLADVVKETAEQTLMANSGFVYDAQTKLYCNYSTGYYYDSAQGLYYNGHTGTYYTYDADKQEYRFHSQVELPPKGNTDQSEHKTEKTRKQKNRNLQTKKSKGVEHHRELIMTTEAKDQVAEVIKNVTKTRKVVRSSAEKADPCADEVEEGELDTSSSEEDISESEVDDEIESGCDSENTSEMGNPNEEQYPPCIRAIILESSCEEIKKGSLFLVTCMGGTIGREGFEHAILLPDAHVDKKHAQIQYIADPHSSKGESKCEKYFIKDLGTRYGTFLNGKRLSEERQQSDSFEILHGSIVKVGRFSILMHIHPGTFTCGHCEPGLIMNAEPAKNGTQVPVVVEKVKSRNAMMRQIKKKYGIERQLVPSELPDAENYNDRSQKRRVVKGSDNPFEKTQVATIDESISQTNKGFKMLSKMGWSAGKTLGQSGEQGLLEPIKLELKSDRGGLGLGVGQTSSSLPFSFSTTNNILGNASTGSKKSKHTGSKSKPSSRAEQLAITMKRFKETEETKMDLYDEPS